MRRLLRLVVATALAVCGGLALPGGSAEAAACSGSTVRQKSRPSVPPTGRMSASTK